MRIKNFLLIVLSFVLLFSCNSESETEVSYLDSFPSLEMIELSFDGVDTISSKDSIPSSFREETLLLMRKINTLLKETHQAIEEIILSSKGVVLSDENGACKFWRANYNSNTWKFTICKKEVNEFYSYWSSAKKQDESDSEFKYIFGGVAYPLPNYDGKKRGFGYIGYNFDNLKVVNDISFSGKLGISYRAHGLKRVVNLGFKNFKHDNDETVDNSLYRYNHTIGVGGVFKYLTHSDVIKKDENQSIIFGKDGIVEYGRRVVAWSTLGVARTSTLICGGTIGEEECIFNAHCWSSDGVVTYNEIVSGDVDWSQCGEITVTTDFTPPSESEISNSNDIDQESGAPILDIPEE